MDRYQCTLLAAYSNHDASVCSKQEFLRPINIAFPCDMQAQKIDNYNYYNTISTSSMLISVSNILWHMSHHDLSENHTLLLTVLFCFPIEAILVEACTIFDTHDISSASTTSLHAMGQAHFGPNPFCIPIRMVPCVVIVTPSKSKEKKQLRFFYMNHYHPLLTVLSKRNQSPLSFEVTTIF